MVREYDSNRFNRVKRSIFNEFDQILQRFPQIIGDEESQEDNARSLHIMLQMWGVNRRYPWFLDFNGDGISFLYNLKKQDLVEEDLAIKNYCNV